jgi:beta-aspartyl-peptidase (threonine type)
MKPITIVIHGGAGTILRQDLTPEAEQAYRQGLQTAMDAGFEILSKQGTSVDAVRAAVRSLEDNILFNAGRGAVFASNGRQEMDAAIMSGTDLMAGAVASVRNIRNPIELANLVMTRSEHVMLIGQGAADFGKMHDIQVESDDYFYSQYRYDQWKRLQGSTTTAMDHDVKIPGAKMGTVGAVACDAQGNIAAATSTGGMTNKAFGRIGDSPIIGAGTYANNKTCAISCTGHGEAFMKAVAAYDVSCLMEYRGFSLKEAMHYVVHDKLLKLDGEGGMIGVDALGNGEMVFNSEGMYRGIQNSLGVNEIGIYK